MNFMNDKNEFIGRYEYLILDGKILNDNRFTGNEKIFYSILVALSKKKGYCFASNSKLSELTKTLISKCETRQVKNYLKKLKEHDYIKIKFEDNNRKIYPTILQFQNIENRDILNYDWLKKGGKNE